MKTIYRLKPETVKSFFEVHSAVSPSTPSGVPFDVEPLYTEKDVTVFGIGSTGWPVIKRLVAVNMSLGFGNWLGFEWRNNHWYFVASGPMFNPPGFQFEQAEWADDMWLQSLSEFPETVTKIINNWLVKGMYFSFPIWEGI